VTETIAIAVILGLVLLVKEWKMAREQQEWAAERQALLQRIQAPEQAIVDYSTGQGELTLHIPFDDDEEAFLAREQMNGRN
jgi:hypothetical protein